MSLTHNGCRLLTGTAILWAICATTQAQESTGAWSVRTDLQGFFSQYSETASRDELTTLGLFLHADYFERAGFTIGYNLTSLGLGTTNANIDQDNRYLSGRVSFTPDRLAGRLTLRLDRHSISNDDLVSSGSADNSSGSGAGNGTGSGNGAGSGTGAGSGNSGSGGSGSTETVLYEGTGGVSATAAQVSYLNFQGTFYWDIGVTRSEYSDLALDGRQLRIDQLAPTIGFGFAERRDWLQLRAYLISASIPSLAAGEKDSTALELKWTHWPIGGGLLGLNNYRFSLTAGDRMFAVDPDAGSVYNLAEVQTGSLSIGGEWAPSDRNRIMLLLGTEQYENQSLGRDYSSAFVYLNLSHRWE